MTVIPFGLIGAVLGHLLLSLPLSGLSLCGIVALAGVLVNDGLVMVDFINRRRQQGQSRAQAAQEAGVARFRAVILTSLTTFCGLLPIVLEKSVQAQIVIPMAVSLAFGILFATVITLFFIPALYLIIEDFGGISARLAAARRIPSTSLRSGAGSGSPDSASQTRPQRSHGAMKRSMRSLVGGCEER